MSFDRKLSSVPGIQFTLVVFGLFVGTRSYINVHFKLAQIKRLNFRTHSARFTCSAHVHLFVNTSGFCRREIVVESPLLCTG